MRTLKGKSLNCIGSLVTEGKIEIFEASKERTLNLLGFIVGTSDRINSMQLYYEKKFI